MEMKIQGRQVGQLRNDRDARNWMVPREGTRRRGVYDGMVLGLSLREIADGLGITWDAAWQHKEVITNWGRVYENRRARELMELEGCEG